MLLGEVKENAMQQPLSGVSLGRCQYRTALHLVNGTVSSQYHLNPVIVPPHEQHRPDFIFMADNAPAHRGTAAVLQM